MLYILGIKIDEKKPIGYILCNLYGINYTLALQICAKIGLNPVKAVSKKCVELGLFKDIQKFISHEYIIGTALQKQIRDTIKKEIHLKTYKGMRHRLKLPVRGQRTHTNRKTQKRVSSI
jgi:small subunit ribosomal protein S13